MNLKLCVTHHIKVTCHLIYNVMSDLDPEGMQDKCNKGKNILHVRDYVSCFTDEHNTYVGCFT